MDHLQHIPRMGKGVYCHPSSVIIGDVMLGDDVSIWPQVVIRGDVHHICVGDRTNVQDHSVLHVTHDSAHNPGGFPLTVGCDVTVGHRVTLHGCTLEDACLIGMGSIILDGARIESGAYVGAGCLVPPGKVLAGGYLYMGQPAKAIRPLTEAEIGFIRYSAMNYQKLKERYLLQSCDYTD